MTNRRGSLWWGILFMTVPILGVATFFYAKWEGIWLPPNVSTYGPDTDRLFFIILWITGIAFVATEGALFWFLIRYRGEPGRKSEYAHSHRTIEILWTVIPGLILLFLALYQKGTWDHIKDRDNFPEPTFKIEVTAAQFQWNLLYAGKDNKFGTDDDYTKINEVFIPVDENVQVNLKSRDVIHSFFLPHFRLKQDALPGMTIPVWFQATKTTAQMREELKAGRRAFVEAKARQALEMDMSSQEREEFLEKHGIRIDGEEIIDVKSEKFFFELACAELCGMEHYSMRGRVYVGTRDEVWAWLEED